MFRTRSLAALGTLVLLASSCAAAAASGESAASLEWPFPPKPKAAPPKVSVALYEEALCPYW